MIRARLLAIGLTCLAGGGALRAQHYTHIAGVIVDASGASVPSAAVTVLNEDTGFRHETLSQQDGSYIASSLQSGVYKITVRYPGFRTMIRFGVKINESQPARVDFKLVVGSLQETITVEGSEALIDNESPSVGTIVGRDEIERLPLNGGGLLSLLDLTPGLIVTPATRGEAGQFTVDGQRPNTHNFMVDGLSANSGVIAGGAPAQSTGGTLPGLTAFGSLDGLVSLDALQEMRVQTSSTAPEFGRLPGAQVSLSSRSGSNEFHGSLLYDFRNQLLDANDWFANQRGDPRPALRLNDFGAALGGPIWRNRTFFFVSYEGIRLSQPFVWNQPVPTLASRATGPAWVQPLLNLFPTPNGPDLGNGLAQWTGGLSRPAQLDAGAARLDQAITSRLTLFARFSESPSSTQFGSNAVNLLDLRSRSLTAGLNWRATPNLVMDLRANVSIAKTNSVWEQAGPQPLPPCYVQPFVTYAISAPGACNYLARLSISGVGDVVAGPEGLRSQSQFEINHTIALTRGNHSISFGADYRRLNPMRQDAAASASVIAGSLADISNNIGVWRNSSPAQHTWGFLQEASLFAEDTWRVTPRLTATYGLRWEISPAPTPGAPVSFLDPSTGTVTPLQQPLWQSNYRNFAPRAGIAYRLTNSGRTVLRAGFGLYYDSSLSLATDLVNNGPLLINGSGSTIPPGFTGSAGLFSTVLTFGFERGLRLPLVKQWNVSIEHALDDRDVISLSYVGSTGDHLIRSEIGGPGSAGTTYLLELATNDGLSNYQGLEAHYRRRMARGLQALASYSWSHSIDNSSSDAGYYWAAPGFTLANDRASSDFDVRQSFSAGLTYEVPSSAMRFLRGWAIDGTFQSRSGFPINALDAEQYLGLNFENVFRPNLFPGQPVWISDSSAPGGRRLNTAAFQTPPNGAQGNLGRNAIAGFGMSQLNLAVRREFLAGEKRSIQLRVEAFNALNHANFADPVRFLDSPLFGQSPSMLNLMLGTGSPGSGLAPIFQSGGARSVQVALRFRF